MSEVRFARPRRVVVKVGSSSLRGPEGLDRSIVARLADELAAVHRDGSEVVLVSSGAVAAGMRSLGFDRRPADLPALQAAASVGQGLLVHAYSEAFSGHGLAVGQVLLTPSDVVDRARYLNARHTFDRLLGLGAVPVVNENDTVVTDEIRFGDNDTLGALVANLIEADVLLILTDQLGMYDCDPRKNALAKIIPESPANAEGLLSMAGDGGLLGRGGMTTKVKAARLAQRSGAHTLIVGGRIDNVINRAAAGDNLGTLLYATEEPVAARKRWLAGQLQVKGALIIDAGACAVLRQQGRSLLPVGVKAVRGQFSRGDLVSCQDEQGVEVARGLANYDSSESSCIAGKPSSQIDVLLGYRGDDELIHRDNLVLV